MDIGDKVKLVKGNPFWKVGIIKRVWLVKGPVNLTNEPRGLKDGELVKHFEVEADDGTIFSVTEDDFELIK
jgi:hypothetical protein